MPLGLRTITLHAGKFLVPLKIDLLSQLSGYTPSGMLKARMDGLRSSLLCCAVL